MNLKSNWWLIVVGVLTEVWLSSAIFRRAASLKKRWSRENRSTADDRVKKVRDQANKRRIFTVTEFGVELAEKS